jgi:hypothetical protein
VTERIPLAVEGVPTGDGRLLEPGSLRWPDEPVPVTMATPGEEALSSVVGWASNFGREDGVVSADITLEAKWEGSIRNHSAQIAVHHVHKTDSDGLMRVHGCDLMNVHLMPGFTNAWPQLDHRMLEDGDRAPAWEGILLDYLHGRTAILDFKGNEVPARLRLLLSDAYTGSLHHGEDPHG